MCYKSLVHPHALAAGLPAVGAAVQCSPPFQLLSTPTAQHQVLAGQQHHVTQPIHAHNALLARLLPLMLHSSTAATAAAVNAD
jgi:hypothetical protein